MNFIPAEEVEKLNATGWQNINKNADVLGEQGMRLERPCLPGGCCGVPFRIFVSSGGGEELGAFLPNPSFLFLFLNLIYFERVVSPVDPSDPDPVDRRVID